MIKKVTREEAIDYLEWVRPKKPYTQDKKNVQTAIDMAIEALKETERNPTITSWYDFDRGYEKGKAAARSHGEWIYHKYDKDYECSECHVRFDEDEFSIEIPQKDATWLKVCIYDFCPHCGSDNRPKEGESD